MTHSPEQLVRRLIEEGFNDGNLDVTDELFSPDFVEHQNFGPGHAPGPAGVRAVISSLRRAVVRMPVPRGFVNIKTSPARPVSLRTKIGRAHV